jgi:D-amino peptidase
MYDVAMKGSILCLLLAVQGFGFPAGTGARILIVTDLEGVGGVNNADEQLLPGQRRYEESRRLLTGEVNAAVEGAFLAGASQVVIWDGHDGSRTLSIDQIHPRSQLIQGRPTPPDYYLKSKLYDGIMFVGQHAMAGAPNGILAHSQSFSVERITLNGKPVGELGQVAAIGGYFDIPVIMLAGDRAACDEMLALQPKAETVAVKHLVGKASTLSLSHGDACSRIRQAARAAVMRVHELKPWKVETPVELKFEFKPDEKQPSGRTAVYTGATVLEAYQAWLGK